MVRWENLTQRRFFRNTIAKALITERRTQPDLAQSALGAYQPGGDRADLIAPPLRLATPDQRQRVYDAHPLFCKSREELARVAIDRPAVVDQLVDQGMAPWVGDNVITFEEVDSILDRALAFGRANNRKASLVHLVDYFGAGAIRRDPNPMKAGNAPTTDWVVPPVRAGARRSRQTAPTLR